MTCMASGKNLNDQILKNETGKSKTLSEPGQEIQIDFSGELNNKTLNSEYQLVIAVDRFSKWPTAKFVNRQKQVNLQQKSTELLKPKL